MNIKDLNSADKGVSTKLFFSSEKGKAISIKIQKNEMLKEHSTPIPAMLLCVSGKAEFAYKNGSKETITPGDYILIEPQLLHWVTGLENSELVLYK